MNALAVGRRVSWGLVDQVLSSTTNFALTVLVARSADRTELGAFAIVLATYLLLTGLGQGLVAQPFAARHSGSHEPAARGPVSGAAGAAVALGVTLGVLCLVAGIAAGGHLGDQLAVLGLTLPGLLLQDAWRFVFVALGHPARAAANDLVWAALQAGAFALLLLAGRASPLALVAAWALAGCAGAVLGCAQARRWPSLIGAVAWVRSERRVAVGFMAQALVIRGAAQLLYTAIALVSGLGAAGTLRGAQVILGPLTLLYQGLLLAAVPEGVRALRSSWRSFSRFARLVSVAATGPAVAWSLAALALPDGVGRQAIGSTWSGARALLPALAVQVVAIAVSLGPQVGLRALGAAGRCLRTDVLQAALLIVAGVAGARLGGGVGAALGLAGATAAGALVWWLALVTAERPADALAPADLAVRTGSGT